MYNEEAKTNFIEDYMRSRVVAFTSLTGLFNKTEKYEEVLNKDCSQFTEREAIDMYKDFGAKSVSVLENYNVHLKRYTALRLYTKQISGVNAYQNISKDILKECVDPKLQKQLYVTREELDDIENELFNYTDKAIVEALWHGISGKSMRDLVALERNMFSNNKRDLIFPDGRTVHISKKLSEYLDKAFDETEYLCYGATMKVEKLHGYGTLYKERANARGVESDDQKFRYIYRRVQNYRDYLDMSMLTMKNIQASGLLHQLQKEMIKKNLSMREVLATQKGKELAQQYGYKIDHYIDVIVDKFSGYQE